MADQDQDQAGSPEPDAKQKFREALERKQGRRVAGAPSETGDGSKVHSEHGPASHQKTFRRKSG